MSLLALNSLEKKMETSYWMPSLVLEWKNFMTEQQELCKHCARTNATSNAGHTRDRVGTNGPCQDHRYRPVDQDTSFVPASEQLPHICKICTLDIQQHAENSKCPRSPGTTWEPATETDMADPVWQFRRDHALYTADFLPASERLAQLNRMLYNTACQMGFGADSEGDLDYLDNDADHQELLHEAEEEAIKARNVLRRSIGVPVGYDS